MPRLLEKFRQTIEARHYSRRTRTAYESWIRRYIKYHHNRHPKEMGGEEVTAFLTHLATRRNLSAGMQNQALNALNFLYGAVIGRGSPGARHRAAAPLACRRAALTRSTRSRWGRRGGAATRPC